MIHFLKALPEKLDAGNIYFVKAEKAESGELYVGDRDGNPVQISTQELIRAAVAEQMAEQSLTQSQVEQIVAAKLEQFAAGAPEALDTLKELSAALGNDPDFASNLTMQLSQKVGSAELAEAVDKAIEPIRASVEGKQDALPNADAVAQLGDGTFGGKPFLVVDTVEW